MHLHMLIPAITCLGHGGERNLLFDSASTVTVTSAAWVDKDQGKPIRITPIKSYTYIQCLYMSHT